MQLQINIIHSSLDHFYGLKAQKNQRSKAYLKHGMVQRIMQIEILPSWMTVAASVTLLLQMLKTGVHKTFKRCMNEEVQLEAAWFGSNLELPLMVLEENSPEMVVTVVV